MGQGKIAIIAPQRICGDVRDDDLLRTIRRRSARPGRRPDRYAVDGIRVGLRQARGATMPQPIAVDQENGSEHVGSLLLHEPTKTIEYVTERVTSRDHLESAFLSGQQRFGALAMVDVGGDAVPLP